MIECEMSKPEKEYNMVWVSVFGLVRKAFIWNLFTGLICGLETLEAAQVLDVCIHGPPSICTVPGTQWTETWLGIGDR